MTARICGFAMLISATLIAAPAFSQDQSQQDQSQRDQSQQDQGQNAGRGDAVSMPDPVASLEGLWRVDQVDGSAAGSETVMGRVMRISRLSLASLSAGTCSNPSFAASNDGNSEKVEIGCVGQTLATAEWDPSSPDTVNWSEANLKAVLHRLASAGDLAPKPSSGSQPGGNQQDNDQQGGDQQNNQDDQQGGEQNDQSGDSQ